MTMNTTTLLKLFLVYVLVFCLSGCPKEQTAEDTVESNQRSESVDNENRYASDLDRLGRITERLNSTYRAGFVVVFGVDSPAAGSNMVTVNYGLFDKLTDNGAAVLIAENIFTKLWIPNQRLTQSDIERDVLETDETVGRHIAKAGFDSSGFNEWLEAKKLFASGEQVTVADKMRTDAFMRGYLSINRKVFSKR